jgi:hypothetical protein
VLETIPEPLSPSQRVPAPRLPASHPAAGDSADAEPEADVPVPQETKPLGDRPSPVAADSTVPPPASPPPSGEAARAAPDTCWRVQVAAVPEPERARALRAAAESQTLVPWVIEEEAKLLKVRTKNCMGGADSNELRRRAVAAGFTGAFRFRKPSP